MGSTRTFLTFALLGLAAEASAQVVRQMTPALVERAIQDEKALGCYPLKTFGCFTTPYSRVVQAASEARKKYKAFAASDVAPEMLAPEIHVLGFAQGNREDEEDWTALHDIEAIVLAPPKSKDTSKVIAPTAAEQMPIDYTNEKGQILKAKNLKAVFPLAAGLGGEEPLMRWGVVLEARFVVAVIGERTAPLVLDSVR